MRLPLFTSLTDTPKTTATQAKVIQWLNRPSEARIGRIIEKFKDNAPDGWPATWSVVFEQLTGDISEWPAKQFHEFNTLEFDSNAFLLKGFLSQEVQLLLIKTYRDVMKENKLRMTPPDKAGKTLVGMASLGWKRQARGYGEPKVELPNFVYDLAQLAIKTVGESLPVLGSKSKCSALIEHFDCYTHQGVEVPLHTESSEDADLFESGQPLVLFSLGCQANFYWRSTAGRLIESGDCIVFGKEARLMQFGFGEIIPDTEPELTTLTTPFKGATVVTVRQVKA